MSINNKKIFDFYSKNKCKDDSEETSMGYGFITNNPSASSENPNPQEVQILSKVVEVRGRNPRDYSLPIVDKISTLDI